MTFCNRAGFEIPAYLTVPEGTHSKSVPLLIKIHGVPYLHDSFAYNLDRSFFALHGFTVIEPQFRGSQWSGDLQEKGAGGFGHEMIEDTVDAIEWALRQNDVRIDPENIFLYGASYGGYQTLMLACQWQEFVPQNSSLKGFKGAISVSPPSVLRCFLKYTLRKWGLGQ